MKRSVSLAAVLLLVLVPTSARAQIDFPDFSSVDGLTLNGVAVQEGSALRLTASDPCPNFASGSAWFTTPQPVENRFETTFTFQISASQGAGGGADGLTFTMQNVDEFALGNLGGGMGYEGIPNSVTVEFDTFFNFSNPPDPDNNHIGINLGGDINSLATFSLGTLTPPVDLKDGNVHTVRIVHEAGTLEVFFDGDLVLGEAVDVVGQLGGGAAFVGFTSGIAGGCGNHDVLSWSFTPDTDGDGILDSDDVCPGTVIPERVPTVRLNPNHWALVDGDTVFDTVKKGKGKGAGRRFTTLETGGCSCEQIIEAQGLGKGHRKHGCSNGVMDNWVARVHASKRGTDVPAAGAEMPDDFDLSALYPNPFNPQAQFTLQVAQAQHVTISVHDLLGRQVDTLHHGVLAEGQRYTFTFEAGVLPSGTYLIRAVGETFQATRSAVLMK